ncbi:FDLD family class I lanthipeptide [Brevibacillus sp. HB1.3]|nr:MULTISPECIES: FDLD family class I lanthipeptide [Bacillales]
MFDLDVQVNAVGSNGAEPNTVRTTLCWVTRVTCKSTCTCVCTAMCTPGCPFSDEK